MIYLLILFATYFVWLFLKSKNTFFDQDREVLAQKRNEMILLLCYKGLTPEEIEPFKEAYDFFCKFPSKFDGATIVKDLHDIKDLDLKAMRHDYECLTGANRDYILWIKSAWQYYQNHFKLGNGNQLFRFIGLLILGIFFVPYCYFFTAKYSLKQ